MCKKWGKEIICLDYLLQLQISMCMLEIKISLYMCMEGKKERKEGRRKTGDNPCELPSKDFWRYVRDTHFSAYVEGRKERENSCGLCITDTDFCLYINTDLLIHIWPIPFIFFFSKALCLKVRVSCVVNDFPCMSSFCEEGASSVTFFFYVADYPTYMIL